MLKKLLNILFLFSLLETNCLQVNIKPEHYEKKNVLIDIINADKELRDIALKIKSNFEFGNQLNVSIRECDKLHNKKEIIELDKEGFPFVLFINKIKENFKNGIEWRLYDSQAASMLLGKKHFNDINNSSITAHAISDQIWQDFIGSKSCFGAIIVACKKNKKNKFHTNIYAFQPFELVNELSKPKVVVSEKSICLAPRWNNKKPLLYYSKHTNFNVRLMSIDINKNKGIVSNFDGLNLTPAFSNDNKIVLSLTKEGKGRICKYTFDTLKMKGVFTPLTDKDFHAVSPSFIDEERIALCLINKLNRPRIAIFNINNLKVDYITKNSESCVSPAYCKANNKIAYCKKIAGFFQIFLYDFESGNHKQLTFSLSDKDSCSWSPCGNYLVFTVDNNNRDCRLAILDIANPKIKFLTAENESWSSPCWSPVYEQIPFL